jgi:hypothetical protein
VSGRRNPKQLENSAEAQVQRAFVVDRSDGLCEFEVAYVALLGETHRGRYRIVERDSTGVAWVRCGEPAIHAAHIFRRWKCGALPTDDGPPLKYHSLVVLAACHDCHVAFDSRQHDDRVRPPAEAAAKARALIAHTIRAAIERYEATVMPDLSHF